MQFGAPAAATEGLGAEADAHHQGMQLMQPNRRSVTRCHEQRREGAEFPVGGPVGRHFLPCAAFATCWRVT